MSKDATSTVTTHDDGKYTRSAIVADKSCNSLDVVDKDGKRVAQSNIFLAADGSLIVDVIDVERVYTHKLALTFDEGQRSVLDVGAGTLV